MADRAASVAAFGNWLQPMLKCQPDLDRYSQVIRHTRPEVIIETGTRTGASALWFAQQGLDVITVDIDHSQLQPHIRQHPRIATVLGDSANPATAAQVRGRLVDGPSCMVSLDSDHSADHVYREIQLYAPMVGLGCYLVVEDGILAWLDQATLAAHVPGQVGNPLQAIERANLPAMGFQADAGLDEMHPIGMFPNGWWERIG